MNKAIFVLLLLLAQTAQVFSADAVPESLRAYIQRNQRRQAYGVYVKGQKYGWALDELKLGQRDGREVAIYTFEMHGGFKFANEPSSFDDVTTTTYALDGDGEIAAVDDRSIEDGHETMRTAIRDGNRLLIKTRSEDEELQRTIDLPKENLRAMADLENWLKAASKKGSKFQSYSTAWEQDNVNIPETFTYRGKKTILWGGVKTEIYLVTINSGGMIGDCEVTADGTPIKGLLGGIFELRAEKESAAKDPGHRRIDMLDASAIPVNKNLGHPEEIDSTLLRIEGVRDFTIPSSHRQKIQSRHGSTFVIALSRDHKIDQSEPLSAAERENCLKATPSLQSDQEPVRALAKEIVGSETAPAKKAFLLQKWLYQNIRQTMAANRSTALEVLRSRAGDCTEISLLFVALARAAGIPAREVGGIMYADEARPIFGWHAWAEIHDGSQWLSVDPTWNQFLVDGTHLKLTEGDNDWSWVNLLGRIKIKVLKFSRKQTNTK